MKVDHMNITLRNGPVDYYEGTISHAGVIIGEVTGPTLFGVIDRLCEMPHDQKVKP